MPSPLDEIRKVNESMCRLWNMVDKEERKELNYPMNILNSLENRWMYQRRFHEEHYEPIRRLTEKEKNQIDLVGREKERERKRKREEEVVKEVEQGWIMKKKTRRSLSSDEDDEDEIEESVEESEVEEELEEIEESEDEEDITSRELKPRKIVININ
jgi:hypothetical protein